MALKMIDTSPKSSDVCHGLFLVIKRMELFMYGVFGRDRSSISISTDVDAQCGQYAAFADFQNDVAHGCGILKTIEWVL